MRGHPPLLLGSSLDGRGWADRCALLLDQHRIVEPFPRPLQRLSAESKQTSCLAELPDSNIVHLPVALAEACVLRLSNDGSTWKDDLAIAYRRAA
ncbi:MAG: hypothetical protein ICV69_07760 [Thermoleophilaceae bacterium]|nr:hypothetical protein [Thermoleophilaceae bacterium]